MNKKLFAQGIGTNAMYFMGLVEGLSGKQVDAFVEVFSVMEKLDKGDLTLIETSVLDDLESNQKKRRK